METKRHKMFYVGMAMSNLWAVATILAEYPAWVFCIVLSAMWAMVMTYSYYSC